MADTAESVQIGGYRILRPLAEGRTYLAEAEGRTVVLKMLDSDCLLKGQLHPMIRDRLGRVRELAHLGVANLYGVERDGQRVYMVWEYVEGSEISNFKSEIKNKKSKIANLLRESVLAVEGMHALGIVHGAVHGRNVIVTECGTVRLTHISPLLYNDPEVDVEGLRGMLREAGLDEIADMKSEISDLNSQMSDPLREMAARLAEEARRAEGGADVGDSVHAQSDRSREERTWRAGTLIGAILAVAAGAIIAWAVWTYADRDAQNNGGIMRNDERTHRSSFIIPPSLPEAL